MRYMELKRKYQDKLYNPSHVQKLAQRCVKIAKIKLQAIQKQGGKQSINSEVLNKPLWQDDNQKQNFVKTLLTNIDQQNDVTQKIKVMRIFINTYPKHFKSLMQKDLSGARSEYLDQVSNKISQYGVKFCLSFEQEVVKHCGETSLINDWDL